MFKGNSTPTDKEQRSTVWVRGGDSYHANIGVLESPGQLQVSRYCPRSELASDVPHSSELDSDAPRQPRPHGACSTVSVHPLAASKLHNLMVQGFSSNHSATEYSVWFQSESYRNRV